MIRRSQAGHSVTMACLAAVGICGCSQSSDAPPSPSPSATASQTVVEEATAESPPAEKLAAENPGQSDSATAATDQPESDPALISAEALDALEKGEDDRAFSLVRKAIALSPEDPQVVFLMAMILSERHRYPEAIRNLDQLAERVPSSRLPVLGQTAEWLVTFGQWSEAEKRYRSILSQAPNAPMVHRKLAELFLRQGRRQEAASHIRKLCRLGDVKEEELRSMLTIAFPLTGDAISEHADPIGALGMARSSVAQNDWDAAVAELLEVTPRGPEESALLGRVYAVQKNMKALEAWRNEAQESWREHSDYWVAAGTLHRDRGESQAAVKSFAMAVLRDPTDSEAYEGFSQSLKDNGAVAEAKAAAERAEVIRQTHVIGEQMASGPQRDSEQISKLIDLLGDLHRPFEALSWRGVRLAYGRSHSAMSEAQAKQILSQIVGERLERLKSFQPDASQTFLLCGVDLDALNVEEEQAEEEQATEATGTQSETQP